MGARFRRRVPTCGSTTRGRLIARRFWSEVARRRPRAGAGGDATRDRGRPVVQDRMIAVKNLRTIVVVETEPALRGEATEMFESAGLQVIGFADGESALAYLRSHKDDVEGVFLDVEESGTLDGIGLANDIEQVCPTIAVIATGSQDTHRPDALHAQVRYLPKPWKALDVVNAMQDIVMGQ